ncbi:short chain dehydrogenase domain-containing protein [Sarocladium implicatum]|nr:short chain dehydrogenase domain-containing protein [Sarocladium implicatum]
MPSYVITGASRGLGYAFVQTLGADPLNTVIGLARDKESTDARLGLDGFRNVHILAADITDDTSLQAAALEARRILGDTGLDVLINNAAYVSQTTALKSLKDSETDLESVIEDTQRGFDVNVHGTLKSVYAFMPLLKKGELKKIVAISSGMGDIDLINEAKLPYAAPYSISKAALTTMFAKLGAAYEADGLLFMSLCPGQVNTVEDPDAFMASLSEHDVARLQDMNAKLGTYAAPDFRPMTPRESALACLSAINRSSLAAGFNGSFLSYNGTKRWM